MKHTLRFASERLVALVLPKAAAGACVPEVGTCCGRNLIFNCQGFCRRTTACRNG